MSSETPNPGEDGAQRTPAIRHPNLPAHAPVSAGESVACHCANCGRSWSVHVDLAGYRVRCECGSFIQVSAALAKAGEASLELFTHSTEQGMTVPKSQALFAPPTAPRDVDFDRALEPDALAEAKNELRTRWTTRTILELLLLMLAFLVPQLIVILSTSAGRHEIFLPLASLASSLCVIGIGLFAPGYTFGSLKLPAPRYLLEALLALIAAVAFAFFWIWLVERSIPDWAKESGADEFQSELGVAMALFVMALCPGIFEELAFRGLIQGRLAALFGAKGSIVLTGIAFACAHGVSLGFPIHLGLGLYLCWLRARSASLIPGMLLHAFYNATIVLFT